jgi:hypothetical protein
MPFGISPPHVVTPIGASIRRAGMARLFRVVVTAGRTAAGFVVGLVVGAATVAVGAATGDAVMVGGAETSPVGVRLGAGEGVVAGDGVTARTGEGLATDGATEDVRADTDPAAPSAMPDAATATAETAAKHEATARRSSRPDFASKRRRRRWGLPARDSGADSESLVM